MNGLRLIPKFARLLSSRHPAVQRSLFSSSSREDGSGKNANDNNGDDYLSEYLGGGRGGGASSDGDFMDNYFGKQPARFSGRDWQPSFGRGRGGRGRGRGRGRGGYGGRPSMEEEGFEERRLTEEELKRREEVEAKLLKIREQSRPPEEEEEVKDEEQAPGIPKSIYTGFIDAKHDDIIKEYKVKMKKMKYKQRSFVPLKQRRIKDEGDEELDDLDKDSDEEQDSRRQRVGAEASLEAMEEEDTDSDLEVDEQEWQVMNIMTSDEFERHLKHREHAKKMIKEYEGRIAALGEKATDEAEVEKVDKLIMKKWRAHYRIPRLITPLEKEEMYKKHKEDPKTWTPKRLAEEYNCYEARVHAILWLMEIRSFENPTKTIDEENKQYLDSLAFDDYGQPCLPPHMGEDKWVTPWYIKPSYKIMPEDWEGSVRNEEELIEEASAKEETMMLKEMVNRMEFNKLQIAGLIKQKKHLRCRPPEGWSYVVEKLGPEGKRGKRGAYRFIATADGKHRKLNGLEKVMLRRETVRPRRRIL